MRKTLSFGRLFLFSPSKAAAACVSDRALLDALKLYALTLLTAAIFYRFRPYDFPDANAAVPLGPQGILFWLKVMLWQPLLMAALVAFAAVLLRWMKDGWLPVKVATSFFWCAIPLILTVFYVKNAIPKSVFGALMIAWAIPGVYVGRGVPSREWRLLAAFLLGLNVVELAAMLPEAIVTMMRWETGYKAVVGLAGFWMLIGGALGLKALAPHRPLPRALLPLLFALVLQIEVVIAAFMLGWLPVETLKALLYG
ncbi:MAG: hypothetical protein PHS14_03210 [Elusimicrobia bacterium]|nr:hypothetical protein [Elusimicrobiota bacterium]